MPCGRPWWIMLAPLLLFALLVARGSLAARVVIYGNDGVVQFDDIALQRTGERRVTVDGHMTIEGDLFNGNVNVTALNEQISDVAGSVDQLTAVVDRLDGACTQTLSAWSSCSTTCGVGTQTRTVAGTTPATNGGAACESVELTRVCQDAECPAAASATPQPYNFGVNAPGTPACQPQLMTLSEHYAVFACVGIKQLHATERRGTEFVYMQTLDWVHGNNAQRVQFTDEEDQILVLVANYGLVILTRASYTADWLQSQAMAIASTPASGFAFSCCNTLSVVGDMAATGHTLDSATVFRGGMVVMFTRTGGSTGSWAQDVTLRPSDSGYEDYFSGDLAMIPHPVTPGKYFLFGGRIADQPYPGQGNRQGSVVWFGFASGSWSQGGQLFPIDVAINEEFGWAISGFGDMVAISAPRRLFTSAGWGRVVLYKFNPVTEQWVERSQIRNPEMGKNLVGGNTAFFGGAIKLYGDRLYIGRQSGGRTHGVGDVHVYERHHSSDTFVHVARLLPPHSDQVQYFGQALFAIGNTLIVRSNTYDGSSVRGNILYDNINNFLTFNFDDYV